MCSDLQRGPKRIEEMTGALLARARVVVAVEKRALLGDHQGGRLTFDLQLHSRQRH